MWLTHPRGRLGKSTSGRPPISFWTTHCSASQRRLHHEAASVPGERGIILLICLIVPRGFCGYLCPLGTTIDLFDWAVGSRTKRFRVADEGWWVHIKYYLLAATLIAAGMGVLLSGFVSAIPVITRALLFLGEPIQSWRDAWVAPGALAEPGAAGVHHAVHRRPLPGILAS